MAGKKDKAPGYIGKANEKDVPKIVLRDITRIADEIAAMQAQKKELEEQASELGQKIIESRRTAAELMAQAGVSDLKTDSGVKITTAIYLHGSIEDSLALYGDLKARGEEGILNVAIQATLFDGFRAFMRKAHGVDVLKDGSVTFTVHHARLDSYLREWQEKGGPKAAWPRGVTVNMWDTVIIK